MVSKISVGSVVKFRYDGKVRLVKVEHLAKRDKLGRFSGLRFVRGWDILANGPVGGFRSFKPAKMKYVKVIASN